MKNFLLVIALVIAIIFLQTILRISDLESYLLALVSIVAAVLLIRRRNFLAYLYLISAILVLFFKVMPPYLYFVAYSIMIIGVFFAWLSLRNSEKEWDRRISLLLATLFVYKIIWSTVGVFAIASLGLG